MILREYQNDAVNSIFEYFFSGKTGNPILALPTGTGKSVIIGSFVHQVLNFWPDQRILMLTHVKELIRQNASKLWNIWPYAPLGIYSAGLKQKDIAMPIIFAGVSSVNSNLDVFGHFDLVIVDECHMISTKESSMYQKIFSHLKSKNPSIKVIGLSATPFRIGQGLLTDDGVFTDFCFDLTGMADFNRLIAQGFLAPLIPRKPEVEIDLSQVSICAGDYNQKELEATTEKVLVSAIRESVELAKDRKCWLVFVSGIKACESVSGLLNAYGVDSTFVHSKMGDGERDAAIGGILKGEFQAIVSNGVLTTGFDCPQIDCIVMLRATMSPALWVQMLGRGTRPSPGKENCLVLDFAGNTKRLGPINDPVRPRKKGSRSSGEVPIRICPKCSVYNHASARVCQSCGYEFPIKSKLEESAGTNVLIKTSEKELPVVKFLDVSRVVYSKHQKTGGIPTLQVSYHVGIKTYQEWVCFEHPGFAGKKAREWWMVRHQSNPPETVDSALALISELRKPKKISVWINKKYPEVLGHEW